MCAQALSANMCNVSHKNFTLAFLGTGDRYLHKVLIESLKSGFKYDVSIPLATHCSCHRSQLLLDAKDHDLINLYMMTDRAVAKTEIQENDCSYYPTCDDCLRSRNPFCRWCGCEETGTHSAEERVWNKLENKDHCYYKCL